MSQLSKAAYAELLDYLKTADESFLNPDKELGLQTHIEGYLHTTHLLSCAMDFYINSDPDFPEFLLFATPVKKILGDNVDSIYKWTQLRGNRRYRISGKRTNQCYLGFTVYRGPVDGSWSTALGANVNHTHIEFAEDGSFEFILSPNPSGPNEYLLEEDANGLITREYFFDRPSAIPAELKIEVLDFDGRPQPITDEELATRIQAAKTFMAATYAMLPFPATFLQNMLMPPFEFGANGQTNGWGTPDNVYAMGNYQLEDDDVLVISFQDHPCCYWGVQTWTPFMQSYDYRYYKVSVNNQQAQALDDGSYEIYVSKTEIDHPNYVGTAGNNEGMVFVRWLLAEGLPGLPGVEIK
ncbi:MAG: hypothetical protein AAF598_08745, partial [Bacteroidota bacterium]